MWSIIVLIARLEIDPSVPWKNAGNASIGGKNSSEAVSETYAEAVLNKPNHVMGLLFTRADKIVNLEIRDINVNTNINNTNLREFVANYHHPAPPRIYIYYLGFRA